MKKNILDKAAIYQNNGRYAIAPHLPAGLITPKQLRMLADVAEKYDADAIKVTSSQRIAVIGIDEERLDEAWNDVGMPKGMAIGMCVRNIKTCPGNRFCPYGTQDTLHLSEELEKRFYSKQLPYKFKMGLSGCSFQCGENAVRDLGFMGFRTGWKVTVGGNVGPAPRLAETLAKDLNDDEAIALAEKVIGVFEKEGGKMRIGKWIAKIGLDAFKSKIGLE